MAIVPTTNGSIDAYAAGSTALVLDSPVIRALRAAGKVRTRCGSGTTAVGARCSVKVRFPQVRKGVTALFSGCGARVTGNSCPASAPEKVYRSWNSKVPGLIRLDDKLVIEVTHFERGCVELKNKQPVRRLAEGDLLRELDFSPPTKSLRLHFPRPRSCRLSVCLCVSLLFGLAFLMRLPSQTR